MIQPLDKHLLITPDDVAPSHEGLEVIGTFNPGAVEHDGEIVLLVRIAERPREHREGYAALPRWQDGRVVIDWFRNENLVPLDARVVRDSSNGLLRLTSVSHVRAIRCRDYRNCNDEQGESIIPRNEWEEYGIEDPRVVSIDGRYWITYVAVSRHGAATALLSTTDFLSYERHGIIFCPENKDVVLFPEKINGNYVALHRPTTAQAFCRPEIWIAESPDLMHWGRHRPLHRGCAAWESDRVGAGTPPLRVSDGWLEIYHASRRAENVGQVGTYVAGIMVLDRNDPSQVRSHSRNPLWEPTADFECWGFVPAVVFPTGIVQQEDRLKIFYGAADTAAAMIEFRMSDLETTMST